jgi:serine/threonine protein kinase
MAPELIIPALQSKINFCSDVYAFGLIIYELIAREPLFNGIILHANV